MDLRFLKWPAILCAVATVAIAALILTGYVSWPLWAVLIPIAAPFVLGAVALVLFYAAWIASGSHAVAALAVGLALVFAAPAFAQDTTIDGASIFGAWKPYIQEMVGIVIAAVIGWVALIVKTKFGLDIEARHREALQSALQNGANVVWTKLDDVAAGVKIDVKNPALAEGVEYVLTSVPDALKYFGLTPERIRQMLLAKIGVVGVIAGEVTD